MHCMTNGKKLFVWLFEPEPRECNIRSLQVSNTVNTDHDLLLIILPHKQLLSGA